MFSHQPDFAKQVLPGRTADLFAMMRSCFRTMPEVRHTALRISGHSHFRHRPLATWIDTETLSALGDRCGHCLAYLQFVDAGGAAAAEYDFAVDQDRVNASGAQREGEEVNGIVGGVGAGGAWGADDDVGAFARFDAAELGLEAGGSGGVQGLHFEEVGGGHGIVAHACGEMCGLHELGGRAVEGAVDGEGYGDATAVAGGHSEFGGAGYAEGEEGDWGPYNLAAAVLDGSLLVIVEEVGVDDEGVVVEDAELMQVDELAEACY